MPVIGLGTFMSRGDEVEEAVYSALQMGYRHIDTADLYMNHEQVGRALKRAIGDGIVKRSDVFLVSKLWPTDYRADLVRNRVEKMLVDLQVDYLDQLLLHMPEAWEHQNDLEDHDLGDTWRMFEELYEEKKVRSIGVSNFGIQRTTDLLSKSRIRPAVNQIEVHPFLPQDKLLDFCTARGMKVVAYAPLGAPGYPYEHPGPLPDVFHHPSIKQIAVSHAKTAAQVALRWAIQRGTVVIPKSVRRERIEENLNIFDFELSEEEMVD
ncbi:aldo-keto reductase, putative [Perkinsus marinus ATCC 50983]|uniref:Aldo-keto reductase, putative n=1 Tax=Perkinsus marinus (strain ATCC 50983 / TXsc) TaxID=423536 RepID=C5KC69_PERM5|nr:aldo-keto reductase, putative [Perkinsus marinus ATCC 50983]EER17882.1 aldo-keto reductase, putative [Perkinsus marinus ATCC 50983]|eukprot:XP_002786086.1 aldo-keto reductase, putative [Perkinsus marinus ATCC 50983]